MPIVVEYWTAIRWLKLDLAVVIVLLWHLYVCLFAGYRSQFLAQGSLGDSPDMIF